MVGLHDRVFFNLQLSVGTMIMSLRASDRGEGLGSATGEDRGREPEVPSIPVGILCQVLGR